MKENSPVRHFFWFTLLTEGLGFSVIMLIFDLFRSEPFSIKKILIYFTFFGLSMALFRLYTLKKRFKKLEVNNFSTEYLESLMQYALHTTKTIEDITEILKTLQWHQNVNIEEEGNQIKLSSKSKWNYWGDPCTIELSVDAFQEANCLISVNTNRKTQLDDYIKNYENLSAIKNIFVTY